MNASDLHLRPNRGLPGQMSVRPGESDPAAMLCRVLVLSATVVLMAVLALAWWLT